MIGRLIGIGTEGECCEKWKALSHMFNEGSDCSTRMRSIQINNQFLMVLSMTKQNAHVDLWKIIYMKQNGKTLFQFYEPRWMKQFKDFVDQHTIARALNEPSLVLYVNT